MDYLERFCELYFHDPAVALLRASEARLAAAEELETPLLDLGCGDGSFLAIIRPEGASLAFDRRVKRVQRALWAAEATAPACAAKRRHCPIGAAGSSGWGS